MIDRGTGTPVVMMPGIQGRWEWLGPAVDALAERCRVITFSLCDEPTSGFPIRPVTRHRELPRAGRRGVRTCRARRGDSRRRVVQRADRRRVCGAQPGARARPGAGVGAAARLECRIGARASICGRHGCLSPLFLLDSPARVLPEICSALPRLGERVRFTAGQLQRTLTRIPVAVAHGDATAVDRGVSIRRPWRDPSTCPGDHRRRTARSRGRARVDEAISGRAADGRTCSCWRVRATSAC